MSMFKKLTLALGLSIAASAGHAGTISFDRVTTSLASTGNVTAVPSDISGSTGKVAATGQIWTGGTSLGMGIADEFLAWCFDLVHSVRLGAEYDYKLTSNPYSNSFLADGAVLRVSQLVNANYDTLDPFDKVEAAGFQLAVWEAAYDDDFDLGNGDFKAKGVGSDRKDIDAQAKTFLDNGAAFTGADTWKVLFLESEETKVSQNLLTATRLSGNNGGGTMSPIPLPAAGFLMLAGLGGLGLLRRRRG